MFFELALAAYLIDYVVGELPGKHPVMFMGDFIKAYEKRYYRDDIVAGTLLVAALLTLSLLVSGVLVLITGALPYWVGGPLLALAASTGLAMRGLHTAVTEVLTAAEPKTAVAKLVSRDTEAMTDTDVIKAALETWAENLSDGVIAPLCYLLVFGLPGLAVYKAVNTLDSMIAYKTTRYLRFGRAPALLDDAANWIPARLTALLIVALAPDKRHAWRCLRRDGHKLDSPNAGYPIAALAGWLQVSLGGDAYYHGRRKRKPALGQPLRLIDRNTLSLALSLKPRLDGIILIVLATGTALNAWLWP